MRKLLMELGWVIFFVVLIAVIMVLCASPAHSAEPETFGDYVTLGKGKPAPFDGLLFTQPAISTIMSKYKALELKCAKDVEYQKDYCLLSIAELNEKCQLNLSVTTKRYEDILKIKNTEIEKLRGTYKYRGLYKFWDKPMWVGIAIGAIITSATLYGVHYAIER
jgi:hypothetical protein